MNSKAGGLRCVVDIALNMLQAKRSSVMPAQAGIQGGGGWNTENLDSRFRGKDGKEKVDFD
jgi:hypothetical protein